VPGPCVLLGNPDDNPILKFFTEKCMAGLMQKPTNVLPYLPARDTFPGRSRGLVAWQIDCVGHGIESLACIAYDAEGMAEAVGTLFEAASNLRPLTDWVLPAHSALAPATKKQPGAPPIEAAWTAQVPDRAVGMAAFGVPPSGGLVVASYDGTLTAFDGSGKKLWDRTTEHSGEHMAFAASPDGKTLAMSGGFWLVAFDASGKELFDKKAFPDGRRQFVTALTVAPDGETIFAGTGDSCVIAFDRRGRRRWLTPEPSWTEYTKAVEAYKAEMKVWERKKDPNAPDKPKPPNHRWPDPYRRVVLSADGTTLLAAASKGAHLYDAAKGAFLGPIPGVGDAFPILADGDGFLAHDGAKALQRISVADRKVAKSIPLPAAQLVALSRKGDGWLLGTESDGAVRLISGDLAGAGLVPAPASSGAPAKDAPTQATWTHIADTRIVKEAHAAGDATVVVYWGGTVRILDAKGALKAETLLPQDVAATALAAGRLIVTLADGRVVALKLE